MLYCPACGYEYESVATQCPDCGGDLVESGAWAAEMGAREPDEPFVAVARPTDEASGVLMRDLLKANGIPALLASMEMPWYGGLASHTMNRGQWGSVLVRRADVARARETLDSYAIGEPAGEDAAEPTAGN